MTTPRAVALVSLFMVVAAVVEPTHESSPASGTSDNGNPPSRSASHGNRQHLKKLGQVNEFSGKSGKPMAQMDPEPRAARSEDAPSLGRSIPSIPSKETGIPRALRGLLDTRFHNINLIEQTKGGGARAGAPGAWTFLRQRLQHLDALGFAGEGKLLEKKRGSHWLLDKATPSTHFRRAMSGVSNSARALKSIGKKALVHLSSWPPQSPLASQGMRRQRRDEEGQGPRRRGQQQPGGARPLPSSSSV